MKKNVKIFGCGISGATMARLLAIKQYQVEIYDVRDHLGGNCYDFVNENQILIHKYGPHIFHTSNEKVYNFITQFCQLNNYQNQPLVKIDQQFYPFPFNYESIDLKYSPAEANYLKTQLTKHFPKQIKVSILEIIKINDPKIQAFGKFVYDHVFANYTAKMWGIKIADIDPEVINRVGITLGYNRSYFPLDKYQGLPTLGYTKLVENIIDHPNIKLHLNFDVSRLKISDHQLQFDNHSCNDLVFYCGSVDELFNQRYGILPYRSLNFQWENYSISSYQPAAIINYPSDPMMTRISEYKKMTFQNSPVTTISKEFPGAYQIHNQLFNQRYYPINNPPTKILYQKYLKLAKEIPNLHLLGRLGEYQYYDMDDAIAAVFNKYEQLNLK